MLTDTLVVFSLNYPLEASTVVVSLGALGLRTWNLKVGQADNQTFWTLWLVSFVKICEDGKVFLKRRVEDFDYFRDKATQMLIGLLESRVR